MMTVIKTSEMKNSKGELREVSVGGGRLPVDTVFQTM